MAKSTFEKYQEFHKLAKEYLERHPKEEDPRNYAFSFGINGIRKILKEAGARVVNFREGEGEDEVYYSFA